MTLTLHSLTALLLAFGAPAIPTSAIAQATVQDSIAVAFAAWYHSTLDLTGTRAPIPHVELDTSKSVKAFVAPFLARFPNATVVQIEAPVRAHLPVTDIIVHGDSASVFVRSFVSRPRGDGRNSDYSDSRYTYSLIRKSEGWTPGSRLLTSAQDGTLTSDP